MNDCELTKPIGTDQLDKASNEDDKACRPFDVQKGLSSEPHNPRIGVSDVKGRRLPVTSPEGREDGSFKALHGFSPERSGGFDCTLAEDAPAATAQLERSEPPYTQEPTVDPCQGPALSSGLSGDESPRELLDRCQWIIDNRLVHENLKKMDDDFWNSRAELMNIYASIINADLQFALHNRVVHKMWKHGVKAVIDQYHRLLNNGIELVNDDQLEPLFRKNLVLEQQRANCNTPYQSLSDRQRIVRVNYTHFLEETRGFYLRLIMTVTLKSGRICGLTDGLQISGNLVLDSLVSSPLKRLFLHAPGGATAESSQQKADIARQQRALQAIIHSLLVQIGDLARYLHHFSDAERCYERAACVAPSLGQPYNQLAILFEGIKTNDSRDSCHNEYDKRLGEGERMLNVTFYYVRALAVPVAFTLAAQNLRRITKGHGFSQFAGRTENRLSAGDSSSICSGTNHLLNLFLYIFAQIYDAIGIPVDKGSTGKSVEHYARQSIDKRDNADPNTPLECKLAAAIHKLRASIVPVLTQHSLSSQCLVQIAALSIFLHYSSIRGASKQQDDPTTSQCCKISPFSVALLTAVLDQLIEVAAMPFSSELTLNRFHVLPAAYILLLYVLNVDQRKSEVDPTEDRPLVTPRSLRQSVEMSPVFWLNLGRLLSSFNVLDKELGKGSFFQRHAGYLLAEERYLQCFLPLDGLLGCSCGQDRGFDVTSRKCHTLQKKGEENAANLFHSDFLCEKDELQLRKIRMVSILQRYLTHSKQSLDEGETCPIKCLRNVVPLKIVLLPVANKTLSTDDSENCGKAVSSLAPRQLCFQSDLSLLQKMQSTQETKQESVAPAGKHDAKRRQWCSGRNYLQQRGKPKYVQPDSSEADPAIGCSTLNNKTAAVGREQVARGVTHPQFIQHPSQAPFAPAFNHANPVAMATMLNAMRHFLQEKQAMTSPNTSNNAAVAGHGGSNNILCQPMWYQLNGRPNSMMSIESRCVHPAAPSQATHSPHLTPFSVNLTQPTAIPHYDQWPTGASRKSPSLPGALAQKFNNLSAANAGCHHLQIGEFTAMQRLSGQSEMDRDGVVLNGRQGSEPLSVGNAFSVSVRSKDRQGDGSLTTEIVDTFDEQPSAR